MNDYGPNSLLTISIPRIIGADDEVVVGTDSIRYGKIEIPFIEVEGVAYSVVRQSINFVPVEQQYSFLVASAKKNIHVYMESKLHIGGQKRKDAWAALVRVAVVAMQPLIVEKLVHRIFNQSTPVDIGGVTFTSVGYSRKKLFGGVDSVPWSREMYRPVLEDGEWTIWRNPDDGRSRKFCAIDFTCLNGPVVDALMLRCYRMVFP